MTNRGNIILKNPIRIDGKDVKEFTYDTEAISVLQFTEACRKASAGATGAQVRENDTALHTYLGMMAITAVSPKIDISDLERVTGFDAVRLANLGRLFILGRLEEPSEASTSEKQSDGTPTLTDQV